MGPVLPFSLDLEHAAPGTLTTSLHQQLRAAILDGRLIAGVALPSTRGLSATYGIARNTVVTAYDLLVAEGYLLPRKAARPVVADVLTRRPRHSAQPTSLATRIHPRWRSEGLAAEQTHRVPARSFRLGMPESSHFPHAVWRRLTSRTLREFAREPFHYPATEGLPELREAIAAHAAFSRAVVCRPEDVVVTSSAQQAHHLIAQLLVRPGRTRVAVEDPGYPPTRAAFLAAGAELIPVAVDEEGLRVDQLPEHVDIVCVTPSHQSPTGVAMSMRRRQVLLDFAAQCDAVVIEDDYDGEFRFGPRPLDALQTLDAEGRVFYVGTFSKSLFPAIRKGFVVPPQWAREGMLAVKSASDPHNDAVAQKVLAHFIHEGHLARHVRRMTALYGARRETLLEEMGRMDRWFTPIASEAGLHLAVRVHDEPSSSRVIALARKHAPGAVDIARFALAPYTPALAFGYGTIDRDSIRDSLGTLRRALSRGHKGIV